jgi:sulfur relay protein TusB/DsrH
LTLAKEGGGDIILLQNGVYFAQKERLGSFPGVVYVLDDDMRLRGIIDSELDARAKTIDYDKLTDIITGDDKVVGLF